MALSATIRSNEKPNVPIENAEQDDQLQITLRNPQSEIVRAEITLFGFPVGDRVDPAVLYPTNAPNGIKKAIEFDRGVAVGHTASINVSIREFSTVNAIELKKLVFSDGSIWQSDEHKYCRALPPPVENGIGNTLQR